MVNPTYREMELNMMSKGTNGLGVQRIPTSQPIPKMSQGQTRVGNSDSHHVGAKKMSIAKKMKKVMKYISA